MILNKMCQKYAYICSILILIQICMEVTIVESHTIAPATLDNPGSRLPMITNISVTQPANKAGVPTTPPGPWLRSNDCHLEQKVFDDLLNRSLKYEIRNADDREIPFLVSVQQYVPETYYFEHVCEGTLITLEWILTSSLYYKQGQKYQALAGVTLNRFKYLSYVMEYFSPNIREVSNVYLSSNNLMLMKVAKPYKQDERIGTVYIVNPNVSIHQDYVIDYHVSYVAGWDMSEFIEYPNDENKKLLQIISLTVVPMNVCVSLDAARETSSNQSICTVHSSLDMPTCASRAGDPLLHFINDTWIQIGINYVDKNTNDCTFLRIDSFVDFIMQIIPDFEFYEMNNDTDEQIDWRSLSRELKYKSNGVICSYLFNLYAYLLLVCILYLIYK